MCFSQDRKPPGLCETAAQCGRVSLGGNLQEPPIQLRQDKTAQQDTIEGDARAQPISLTRTQVK
jgi:hypothetical protein